MKLTLHLYIVLILRMPAVHCHLLMPDVSSPESPLPTHPQHIYSSPVLILSDNLHIGFPNSLFPSDIPNKQHTHLSPMHATCPNPSHPPSFDHPNNICTQYKSQISSHDAIVYRLILLPLSQIQIQLGTLQ